MLQLKVDRKGASSEEYLGVLARFQREVQEALAYADQKWGYYLLGEYQKEPEGVRRRAYLLLRRQGKALDLRLLVWEAPENEVEDEQDQEVLESMAHSLEMARQTRAERSRRKRTQKAAS